MAKGPLTGIRILDLTHVWSGPLAARILADLGAEVIKIEAPYGRGPQRALVKPLGGWLGGEPGGEPWNRAAINVKLARNRKSVCINLKTPAGRETFLALADVADLVMENFSVRAMPALGLDYAALSARNHRIIYLAMPGFGNSGPYRDRVAFGPSVEPMSGLTQVMGYSSEEPCNTAMALMDPIAAVNAAGAAVTALRRREVTGKGMRVEVTLHEAGVCFSGPWLIEEQLGASIQPAGNRHPQMAPHGIYPCSGEDEWIALACRTDSDWTSLCALVGRGLDPSASVARRRAAHDAIDAAITGWTGIRSRDGATAAFQAVGIPAGPVNTTPDMMADPQIRHRGFFVPLEQFDTPMPGTPIHMQGTSPADWTPCPKLGADNASVLSDWLNYSSDQIAKLEELGVLLNKPPG